MFVCHVYWFTGKYDHSDSNFNIIRSRQTLVVRAEAVFLIYQRSDTYVVWLDKGFKGSRGRGIYKTKFNGNAINHPCRNESFSCS